MRPFLAGKAFWCWPVVLAKKKIAMRGRVCGQFTRTMLTIFHGLTTRPRLRLALSLSAAYGSIATDLSFCMCSIATGLPTHSRNCAPPRHRPTPSLALVSHSDHEPDLSSAPGSFRDTRDHPGQKLPSTYSLFSLRNAQHRARSDIAECYHAHRSCRGILGHVTVWRV